MFPEEVILLLSHGNTGSSGVAATLVSPPAGAMTDPQSRICMGNEISAVSAKTGSSQYVAYNSVAKILSLTILWLNWYNRLALLRHDLQMTFRGSFCGPEIIRRTTEIMDIMSSRLESRVGGNKCLS